MKTLKYFSLVFLMLFSVRVMAQSEIKMHTGSVNIGEGKTYYFFDSGGEEEFTAEEDPNNDYRWKTMYQHNEVYTLTFKVPEDYINNSNKGIKVTFRSLFINNDSLFIYEGNPGDSLDMSKRIVALTNNSFSTDYGVFSVMSHGNMNIRFRADGRWRDAGWEAIVELADFAPQAPVAMRMACINQIVIFPTCIGGTSYFTKGGTDVNNPTNASDSYSSAINIENDNYPVVVKTISYIGTEHSEIYETTLTSKITAPTQPRFEYIQNDNILYIHADKKPNLNDTWYVRYSDDNDPASKEDTLNGNNRADVDTVYLTQTGTIKAVVHGTTCSEIFSAIDSFIVSKIYVPAPVIEFTGTGENGTTEITCSWGTDAVIYYTTDGSEPTTSSTLYNGPFTVQAGKTVKARTFKKNQLTNSDYEPGYASRTYIPGGEGGSGAFGSIVVLDDREDHSWSYYSDTTNPIRSLNPADVKITYFGNGINNISTTNGTTPANDSWTQSATGVQVSYNKTENQFIYLKTLERTDGTTATSVENAQGRCEYTTISNPFSKRPTYQYASGDLNKYCGFYGWRIKSIRGGKIYSAANNGVEYTAYTSDNLATTNMLNAETTYYFAPDKETGMEVELEALWARAYVATSNTTSGLQSSVGYERNFVYLSSSTTIRNDALNVPVTYTTLDPATGNGTKSTITIRDNFTCEADTKFENVTIAQYNNNSQTITANNHNLIFGRGVGGTVNTIQGYSTNSGSTNVNTALAYTIQIESGTINNFYLINNTGGKFNSTVQTKAVIGCDYDRAKNDTTNLDFVASGQIFGKGNTSTTYGIAFTSPSNRNNITFDWYVKSGRIQRNLLGSASGGEESIYLGHPTAGDNAQYTGKRRITIEGGVMASIAGGVNNTGNSYSTYAVNDGDPTVMIRIKGGTIRGAVYGAGEYGGSSGNTRFVFTGGTIKGWIAGGANGTQSDGGVLYGTSYVYVGGKTQVNSSSSTSVINRAIGGNVFGAGCGYNASSTSGQVQQGTNVVIADEAYVERGVYGGGSYGYTEATANIYILGGTIDGKAGGVNGTSYDANIPGGVYGGACQNKGGVANIIMNNGTVNGSVYGGSNSNGTLSGNVTMNITGGQVTGNVHGGGYGENTNVAGNVEVTIGGTNPQDTPTIKGDVYGGGALGKVNTANGSAVAGKTTHVTVNSGTLNNVYGGGLGQSAPKADTYTIDLSWTIQDRDGNHGYVTYSYTDESGNTITSNQLTSDGSTQITVPENSQLTLYAIGSRSGSGWSAQNLTSEITAKYNTNNHTIITANSSGNYRPSTQQTTIDGIGSTDIASVAANVGTVTVDINGGTMNKVFGCNNQNGAPQGAVTVNFINGEAIDVYGGGKDADYTTGSYYPIVNIKGGKVTNCVYGGGAFAKVNKTIVNMTDGEAGSVYAGAQGDNKSKTLVNGNKTVNMQGGTAIMVYGGSFTCQDVAKSFVNISGGRVKTNVFGSGYFGDMNGDCFVYIGKNAIKKAPHNGENGDTLKTLSDENPIWIESNVYAGANWGSFEGTFGEATITGASNIYIDGTGYNMDHGKTGNYMIISGSVFGSGTSCAAGITEHSVIVRHYGNMTYPSMTRSLRSIQRVSKLILDSSSIDFIGQGDISSMDPTVEYGIINIDTIYAANNSNMALSKPLDNVNKLGSYTCTDVYVNNPDFETNNYDKPHDKNNGIVINNGGYLMVRYDVTVNGEPKKYYGELQGFFNMREPGDDAGINNEGYIFARPKIIADNGESLVEKNNTQWNVFASDGGFVDFDANVSDTARNTFDKNGNKVRERTRKRTEYPAVQMPYTNRTDQVDTNRSTVADNNTDYRFWRFDPDTVPVVTREVVFVVKADKDAGSESTKFLTTTGSVQLPPSLGDYHKYYISGLTWGADGKDCNPANITKTNSVNNNKNEWRYYDEGFKYSTDSNANNSLEEYYANPNSTFGFLMSFDGNFKKQDPMILDNNSFQNYFNERAHVLAEVDAQNTTDLPELDFLVTYSDRLSQNEMWAEARMVIDEVDSTGNVKQRIYLNISVTTITKFGQDVETYVYASTDTTKAGQNGLGTYLAQLNLPTFELAENTKFYATFKAAQATESDDFGEVNGTPVITLADYNANKVAGTTNLALQFNAESNDDNTNGWYHKGNAQNPNQPVYFDFYKILNNQITNDTIGASDGRKYTTIAFNLLYDPTELSKVGAFSIGQKHVGDLFLKMEVNNIKGGITNFNIIVHVYVTGPTKFYYLDGVAGKDGNNGMFPDKAKKTLNGVLNASGYTVEDPIFVVQGVAPKAGSSLTWNANKFLNSVKVPEEDQNQYTEEQLRQLSQVKVYRYPGGHPKEDGTTDNTMGGENDQDTIFYNGMYTGQIINVPEGSQFAMHNVCLSGGSDLDNLAIDDPKYTYNPKEVTMESAYPLISIAEGAIVSIENSSLVYNNNTGDTKAGAIYNEGNLTVDGIYISGNKSVAENGKGAGVYQADTMKLGNTATITIVDQVYLDNKKIMEVPNGILHDSSKFSDILIYYNPKLDTSYSGRVIVRYDGAEPDAPKLPYWKDNLPERQTSILKSRKANDEETKLYESDKYTLNSTITAVGFDKANGGDPNVLPFITAKMKNEFDPITSKDIIIYSINANLPVELLYFTAECMGEATQLQWSTASETNNEYFTIERSSDAVNYEEVARIQGAGTTSQRSDYSFMADNNSSSMTYYRLRQTDIDGKYEIFAPVALQCKGDKVATDISIYPVPARDQVNIFSSNSPMTRIEIFSIMGAKVATESAEGNQAVLNISNLATGVYAVKVFTEDGQVSNVRLIKK